MLGVLTLADVTDADVADGKEVIVLNSITVPQNLFASIVAPAMSAESEQCLSFRYSSATTQLFVFCDGDKLGVQGSASAVSPTMALGAALLVAALSLLLR